MMVREISDSVGAIRESSLDELWSAALTLAEIATGVEGGALDLPEILAAVGFYGPLPASERAFQHRSDDGESPASDEGESPKGEATSTEAIPGQPQSAVAS